MDNKLIVELIRADISELAQLTQGLNEIDLLPPVLIDLAKRKVANIQMRLNQIECAVHTDGNNPATEQEQTEDLISHEFDGINYIPSEFENDEPQDDSDDDEEDSEYIDEEEINKEAHIDDPVNEHQEGEKADDPVNEHEEEGEKADEPVNEHQEEENTDEPVNEHQEGEKADEPENEHEEEEADEQIGESMDNSAEQHYYTEAEPVKKETKDNGDGGMSWISRVLHAAQAFRHDNAPQDDKQQQLATESPENDNNQNGKEAINQAETHSDHIEQTAITHENIQDDSSKEPTVEANNSDSQHDELSLDSDVSGEGFDLFSAPQQAATTRNDQLNKAHIVDINQGMTLGDRFYYQRTLFSGKGELMTKTILALNGTKSLEEAQHYLADTLHWDFESEDQQNFLAIVARLFS